MRFGKGLDFSNPKAILYKVDGSLMSSVLSDDAVYLKSKGSFHSDHAKLANDLLRTPEWEALYDWTLDCARKDHTVILEYTSPFKQIILPYMKSELTVLAVRNNGDGSYIDLFDMKLPEDIQQHLIKNIVNEFNGDIEAFIKSVKQQEGLEGYVVVLQSGQRVKVKTEWFFQMNSVENLSDLSLAKLVLDEDIDDYRSMWVDSPEMLERIDRITRAVTNFYRQTERVVLKFYEGNKDLPRKDYAALAKKELSPLQMPCAFELIAGKPLDVRENVFKHMKKHGVPSE